MYEVDIVHSLCTIPVNDGNFKSALRRADQWQIEDAIAKMKFEGGSNKARINECERELRRRGIKA